MATSYPIILNEILTFKELYLAEYPRNFRVLQSLSYILKKNLLIIQSNLNLKISLNLVLILFCLYLHVSQLIYLSLYYY